MIELFEVKESMTETAGWNGKTHRTTKVDRNRIFVSTNRMSGFRNVLDIKARAHNSIVDEGAYYEVRLNGRTLDHHWIHRSEAAILEEFFPGGILNDTVDRGTTEDIFEAAVAVSGSVDDEEVWKKIEAAEPSFRDAVIAHIVEHEMVDPDGGAVLWTGVEIKPKRILRYAKRGV